MKRISLSYRHENPGCIQRTRMEDAIDAINLSGGFKVGNFTANPQYSDRRIPVGRLELTDDGTTRKVIYAPETLRGDLTARIDVELNRRTGEEVARIPLGWCGFHSVLEKGFGYKTG